MKPITVLSSEDIELLLDCNGISIPFDKKEMYKIAEELIKKDVSECFSASVMNYRTAYLLNGKINIGTYTEAHIDALSYHELAKISRAMWMFDADKETILEILFCMGKIINDVSDILPDIFYVLLKCADIWDIENIYYSCKKYQELCQNPIIKNIIVSRLPNHDNLDISDYSFVELIRYYKISFLKKSMGLYCGVEYYLYPNRLSFHVGNIDVHYHEPINQILQKSDKIVFLLTAKGQLLSYDIVTGRSEILLRAEKICGIFITYERTVIILTASKTYHWKEGVFKNINNRIIKSARRLFLTDNGEVYFGSQKLQLVKIKQILDYWEPSKKNESYLAYALTYDGQICTINMADNFCVHYHKEITNITELTATKDDKRILDSNGNVYKIIFKDESTKFEKIDGKYQDIVGGSFQDIILGLTTDGEYKLI